MSTTRPLLTQREAAAGCGVSRTTIRRRREAGELPGAVLDDDRDWLIPVEDLLAAGFRLNAPSPPDTPLREKKGTGDPAAAGHSRTRLPTRRRRPCTPSSNGCATSTSWRSPKNEAPVNSPRPRLVT
ncbi:helix-turn-helix domain-containing protein [Streptomyces flaveolus]|uniref:helix-turn-helix domain-containing protein n=1 Tax=Streptomyces flaveolus TaxID=67297 RepID=UPI00342232FC